MKIVFMGTPDFALSTLKALVSHHTVVAVYTRAPRPKGRGQDVLASPVHLFAEKHGIPVFTPSSLKGAEEQEKFRSIAADVAVVAAYGLILPKPVLTAFRYGCLNVHGSLLPRWRGAAPMQRAMLAGDSETGITIMRMDEGLDTGDMLLKGGIPITETTTLPAVHDALAELGAELMIKALDLLGQGVLKPEKQDEAKATYAPKVSKEEGKIDWNKSAADINLLIRSLSPVTPVFCLHGDERLTLLESTVLADEGGGNNRAGTLVGFPLTVQCGSGRLNILSLKRPGKNKMKSEEFVKGYVLKAGDVLS